MIAWSSDKTICASVHHHNFYNCCHLLSWYRRYEENVGNSINRAE